MRSWAQHWLPEGSASLAPLLLSEKHSKLLSYWTIFSFEVVPNKFHRLLKNKTEAVQKALDHIDVRGLCWLLVVLLVKYSELQKWRKATKLKLQKLLNKLIFKQGPWLDSYFCQAADPSYLNLIRWTSWQITCICFFRRLCRMQFQQYTFVSATQNLIVSFGHPAVQLNL